MVRTLASSLSRAGIETHIATTDDNGPEQLRIPLGVPVVEGGVTSWYFRRQTHFYIFSWPLASWLRRHVRDFDLVHIHTLFSFATIPAAFWAKQYGVPYVVRPLGTLNHWGIKNRRPWLKKLSLRAIESQVLKHAEFVHYTSEQEREEAAHLGFKHRSEVIPNPVDSPAWCRDDLRGEFRSRHPELADTRIILFLSRLDRKKGLDLLISAFGHLQVKHSSARLVIAGSGDPELIESAKRLVKQMNLGGKVVWVGFLTGRDKWAALAEADAFVLPSYSENFGIAVVEALLIGAPVVVSDQVAVHREISQAGAGLVVPCNAQSLSDALDEILSSSKLSEKLGRNAIALARERFSAESVIAELIDAYDLTDKPCLAVNQTQKVSVQR